MGIASFLRESLAMPIFYLFYLIPLSLRALVYLAAFCKCS